MPSKKKKPDYKGQLQTYYQRNKLPLPIYESIHLIQTPSQWICTIHLEDKEFFQGNMFATKKEAEQDAAKEVLDWYQHN